jgi:sugar-specific transcriptional regulator TrmB
MNFIPPLEIASKIMTLIQEADKELIIVSPYVSIAGWDKMIRCLKNAVDRGVDITFIARAGTNDNFQPLIALGIIPVFVEGLHAKVYINDRYAIATSSNLSQYSDINSIDIGHITQNAKERNELAAFVSKYVYKLLPKEDVTVTHKISTDVTEKIEFNEFQVEKIHDAFLSNFPNDKFVKTSTYVFAGSLLPFADVMISSRYVIKIKKTGQDCNRILKAIENLNFTGRHNLRMELLESHPSFYYLIQVAS